MSIDPATGAIIENPMVQQIIDVANVAFANGMADAMLIAAGIMAVAAAFVFVVLPSEIRCLEEECADEEHGVSLGEFEAEALPVAGD